MDVVATNLVSRLRLVVLGQRCNGCTSIGSLHRVHSTVPAFSTPSH